MLILSEKKEPNDSARLEEEMVEGSVGWFVRCNMLLTVCHRSLELVVEDWIRSEKYFFLAARTDL